MMTWFFGFAVGALVFGTIGMMFGLVLGYGRPKHNVDESFEELLRFAKKEGATVSVEISWADDEDGEFHFVPMPNDDAWRNN